MFKNKINCISFSVCFFDRNGPALAHIDEINDLYVDLHHRSLSTLQQIIIFDIYWDNLMIVRDILQPFSGTKLTAKLGDIEWRSPLIVTNARSRISYPRTRPRRKLSRDKLGLPKMFPVDP